MKKMSVLAKKITSMSKNNGGKKPEVTDNLTVQISLADLGPVVQDPRPDLPESEVWGWLLAEATARRPKDSPPGDKGTLYNILYAVRKVGAVLQDKKIVPVVGENGWRKKEDFMEVANECLRPYARQIKAAIEKAYRLSALSQQQSSNT